MTLLLCYSPEHDVVHIRMMMLPSCQCGICLCHLYQVVGERGSQWG